jgi:hypothetical protein
LTSLHYELYDPFALIPGEAYAQVVRLFVAPPADGWVRLLGQPDPRQFAPLSNRGLCLSLSLDGTEAQITVYRDGEETAPEIALLPYLRPGQSADALHHALLMADVPVKPPEPDDALPLDLLSGEIQSMAERVNMKQAQKMFDRITGNLLKSDQSRAARDLIVGSGQDWNNAGGQRLRAVADCLTLPHNWREPDFVSVRAAYQLHLRRQRNPDARLFPGDVEVMQTVPDALDYTPVYGGLKG